MQINKQNSTNFTGQTITIYKSSGSEKVGNLLTLQCDILPFDGPATWSRGSSRSLTDCTQDFCSNTRDGRFSFGHSFNGITVAIYPVKAADDNVSWTCSSSGKTESYTVILRNHIGTNSHGSSGVSGFYRTSNGVAFGKIFAIILIITVTVMLVT
ncbi:unnamed protein product [Mytilus coruscus]|uniref:Uncharacterized protein n=1 Tax=Mytilus coruscus TaxID=42192 RepID=A0A6J8AMR5_MYTCO|nr:unnamed protein product [Mytilus coruscus]